MSDAFASALAGTGFRHGELRYADEHPDQEADHDEHPERRRPLLVVLAVGVADEALPTLVAEAAATEVVVNDAGVILGETDLALAFLCEDQADPALTAYFGREQNTVEPNLKPVETGELTLGLDHELGAFRMFEQRDGNRKGHDAHTGLERPVEDHVLRIVHDPSAGLRRDDGTRGRSDGLPDGDDGEDGRRDPPLGGGRRTVVGRGGIRTDRLGCDDVALRRPVRPERLEAAAELGLL